MDQGGGGGHVQDLVECYDQLSVLRQLVSDLEKEDVQYTDKTSRFN